MSELLTEEIAGMCLDMSFRKVASAISETTGQTISTTSAWNVSKECGEWVMEQEVQSVADSESGRLSGSRETKVLFEEMDGLWLPIQKNERVVKKPVAQRQIIISIRQSVS